MAEGDNKSGSRGIQLASKELSAEGSDQDLSLVEIRSVHQNEMESIDLQPS